MKKNKFGYIAILSLCVCLVIVFGSAQDKINGTNIINTSRFQDCSHHWYDIKDEARIIDPLPDQKRYNENEISKIANNILLFQKTNGGWAKNYDMLSILSPEQKNKVEKAKEQKNTTFDNGATHSHVEYLAKAYSTTKDERYKAGCLRGLDFILSAQYKNGGWPQFYPEMHGYSKYITFNDGAMMGVMTVLHNILQNKPYYEFVDSARREKVKKAFEKGIDCILKCQINEKNKLTVWCQQHDNKDFHPQNARTFEPASKCSQESAEIITFLMSIDNPSKNIITAVKSAVEWYEFSKINGIRVETIKAPYVKYQYHSTDFDRIVVKDTTAPPLWTRYYELGTNRSLFCNRDRKVVYSLAEVDRERRTGYMWYNNAPQTILDEFPAWLKKLSSN
jgi:PelA/Pel-15E family pectate lyase